MNKVPVMIIFFNRPDTLLQVFEAVKSYKPEQLFLVQDGPRNENDIENINKCREIVSDDNINWDCKVYRNYSEYNMSCDYREYSGISWCFDHVDRLIILEDDCVPSNGFFYLCEECLEKYKNNEMIHSIYGYNRLGEYECPYDYLFSVTGAGIGWATWKRVWDKVVELESLDLFDDSIAMDYVTKKLDPQIKKTYGDFVGLGRKNKEMNEQEKKITSWEFLAGAVLLFNNMLTIAPKKNLIKYIGITENATHSHSDPRLLPRKTRIMLTQPSHNISFPIKHPPFIIRDVDFEKKTQKILKNNPILSKIEVGLRRIIYSNR